MIICMRVRRLYRKNNEDKQIPAKIKISSHLLSVVSTIRTFGSVETEGTNTVVSALWSSTTGTTRNGARDPKFKILLWRTYVVPTYYWYYGFTGK